MRGQGLHHIGCGHESKSWGSMNVKSQLYLGMITISSLVEGTGTNWITCFLSKVVALWIELMVSPKQVTRGVDSWTLDGETL